MDATPLLNWSLLVLFLVLAAQSVLLGVVVLTINARVRRIHSRSEESLRQLFSFLTTMETTLARVSSVTGRFAEWEQQVREATEAACRAVSEVDEKVEQGLSYLESNLQRWQGQSDEFMGKFSRASNEVYDAVLEPASRVSLFLRAVGTGLKRFISDADGGEDPSHYHQDRQIFI